jgi:D-alanyl-lipoteichoic acid acyltransferase DltB (MBOAT superfamily)
MVFTSQIFIALLVFVLGVYYWLSDRQKTWFLLLLSYFFYGFWSPWLCSLILLSTVIDFAAALGIESARSRGGTGRGWLHFSLLSNLGALAFFKYYDFFAREFAAALGCFGVHMDPSGLVLNLVLPIGISFYTFQTLGYTIDVYRRDLSAEPDLARFALFVSFFPQLVAGPVERAPHLLPQFSRPCRVSPAMVRTGVLLILLGFAKKSVLADRIATTLQPLFAERATDSVQAAVAMWLFSTQIYLDFSSYSDIAVGVGLLLGYHIRPNFDLPFVVPSIPERWRRWHISMSHWFRDYIFIPLGGSRGGALRTHGNIMLLMLLSGLWHGASRNFLMWGLGNGLAMVAHRLCRGPRRIIADLAARTAVTRIGYFYACCFATFCLISTINIFFRSPDWAIAKSYVRAIFVAGPSGYANANWNLGWRLQDGLSTMLLTFLVHEAERYFHLKDRILGNPRAWGLCCAALFIVVVVLAVEGPAYIYFQF